MKPVRTGIAVAAVAILIFGSIWFFRYQYLPKNKIVINKLEVADTAAPQIPRLYNIPLDSFEVVHAKIKRNQMLGDIFQQYNMPSGYMSQLIQMSRKQFDLRKIRAGKPYSIFLSKDTTAQLQYFVYEQTPVKYVILEFMPDSIAVTHGEKPVITVRNKATGTIESSLWNAMVSKGNNPMLANKLSDIYAWSIDFFGLQQKDSFAIVYDDLFVDTLRVGYGKVYAAYFYHAGEEFHAIPFVQDSVESFFDIEGNSLRKAFLKAPLNYSRISSVFSNSRMHPVLKIRRPHHGVDYAAPSGTPVYAIGDGKIISAKSGYNRGGGNMIKIQHNSVYRTAYLHLKGFAKGIKTGVYVKQGDLIGFVGTTGLSTGPHLDFRFYKNNKAIDPLKVDAPPVEPVHKENKVAFDSVKTATLQLLEK